MVSSLFLTLNACLIFFYLKKIKKNLNKKTDDLLRLLLVIGLCTAWINCFLVNSEYLLAVTGLATCIAVILIFFNTKQG